MKTLILYASKYGAASEVARRIATQFGSTKLIDLNDIKKVSALDLSKYDCVIVGSSVYAGQIRPAAKHFVSRNEDELAQKRLGLFIVGFDSDKEDLAFTVNFSEGLLEAAQAKLFAEGIFDPRKANFAERLIIKAVIKQNDYTDRIDDEKIATFAQELKG